MIQNNNKFKNSYKNKIKKIIIIKIKKKKKINNKLFN